MKKFYIAAILAAGLAIAAVGSGCIAEPLRNDGEVVIGCNCSRWPVPYGGWTIHEPRCWSDFATVHTCSRFCFNTWDSSWMAICGDY